MLFRGLIAAGLCYGVGATGGNSLPPKQIRNLVTFGDSYTDVLAMADGGTMWPVYASGYANVSLFPFAKAGATCSNNITDRPFPSVFESQLPAYFAEVSNGTLPFLDPHETLYTLWIGTNDVGANGLLTGHGAPGVSLVDTVTCAINWVKTMYASGARIFLFQNVSQSLVTSETLSSDTNADDTPPKHRTLLCRLLPKSLLDSGAKYH